MLKQNQLSELLRVERAHSSSCKRSLQTYVWPGRSPRVQGAGLFKVRPDRVPAIA